MTRPAIRENEDPPRPLAHRGTQADDQRPVEQRKGDCQRGGEDRRGRCDLGPRSRAEGDEHDVHHDPTYGAVNLGRWRRFGLTDEVMCGQAFVTPGCAPTRSRSTTLVVRKAA